MELREINTFLLIAQYRSFSKAAQHLGYSQAAVTIQISKLENELGVHLFDRIGRQISLTHEGEIFYKHAVSLMRSVSETKDALSGTRPLNGKLRIGTIESLCESIFPDLITEYHRRHPDVQIQIIMDSPDVLLERMNENIIDIVYLLDKRIYDERWHKTFEVAEENIFVTSPDHPLAITQAQENRALELDEVLQYPMIVTEPDASYRHLLEQYLAAQDRFIHPFLESGDPAFILQMLTKVSGVSFLPRFTVQHEIETGQLMALHVNKFYMQTWRQVFYHRNKWITHEMRAFLDLIKELEV